MRTEKIKEHTHGSTVLLVVALSAILLMNSTDKDMKRDIEGLENNQVFEGRWEEVCNKENVTEEVIIDTKWVEAKVLNVDYAEINYPVLLGESMDMTLLFDYGNERIEHNGFMANISVDAFSYLGTFRICIETIFGGCERKYIGLLESLFQIYVDSHARQQYLNTPGTVTIYYVNDYRRIDIINGPTPIDIYSIRMKLEVPIYGIRTYETFVCKDVWVRK